MRDLKFIEITGEICIQTVKVDGAVKGSAHRMNGKVIILMGPTGAGKSAFIEALGGESQVLGISKNQLSGYTQDVTVYKVLNCVLVEPRRRGTRRLPLYLVDTPGFSDSKISEREVVGMVLEWLRENGMGRGSDVDNKILYFIPINDTRLAGTKRRTIEMLATLLKFDSESVTFVTSMWDNLYDERTRQRGELNFAELRDRHLKALFGPSAQLARFTNTKQSALAVLDMQADVLASIRTSYSANFASGVTGGIHLYRELYARIEGGMGVKKMIESELEHSRSNKFKPDVQTEHPGPEALSSQHDSLTQVLTHALDENQETLEKFIGQFYEYEEGNLPRDVDRDAHRYLRNKIMEMRRRQLEGRRSTISDAAGCTGMVGLCDQTYGAGAGYSKVVGQKGIERALSPVDNKWERRTTTIQVDERETVGVDTARKLFRRPVDMVKRLRMWFGSKR